MRTTLTAMVLVSAMAAFAVPTAATADNCICAQFSMYPYPGGYMHYAYVCETDPDGCIYNYPTNVVLAQQTSGQSCQEDPDCGTCEPHRSTDSYAADRPLYFDTLFRYSSLADAGVFRDFLESTLSGAVYDDRYQFTDPVCVEMRRRVGASTQMFYAIVYKVTFTEEDGSSVSGYMGVEVSDTSPPQEATLYKVADGDRLNAVRTRKLLNGNLWHNRVHGLLLVKFADGGDDDQVIDDSFALIRIQRSNANINASYPPAQENLVTTTVYPDPCSPNPCWSPCRPGRHYARRGYRRCW